MKNLLIIGARGFGREVYNMLPDCIGYGTEFKAKGFLDDKADALAGMDGYPTIVDSVENYQPQEDDVFICALGDVHYKQIYADKILNKSGSFISLIHKKAFIGQNTSIGKGSIVGSHVRLSCDLTLGDFISFQPYSVVGHDAKVGNYCHLGVRSFMGGYSEIGNNTVLNTSSIVLPHIKVGNDCVVGVASVVIKKVKDGCTVYGNPAKVLSY